VTKLDADLLERALLIADQLAAEVVRDPDPLVDLGVDLLVAGFDGPSVLALASMSPGGRWSDVAEASRAALREVGIDAPNLGDSGWATIRFWAKQLELGGSRAYQRAGELWNLWERAGRPPEIAALVSLMDEWEVALPAHRVEVEALLGLAARPIGVLADRKLRGLE